MALHSTDHSASALAFVVPCALIVPIAKGAFSGIGSRAIGWQPQSHKARLGCQPLPDRFGFMHLVVVYDPRDTPDLSLWGRALQQSQEVTKSSSVFSGAETMAALARSEIERASEIGFFILPWRH